MPLETKALAHDGQAWLSARGEMRLWVPAPAVLVMRVVGHGDGEFAAHIVARFEQIVAAGLRAEIMADVGELEGYDSELRTTLQDRFGARRASIERFHVLVGSRIVAMGVTVANLALGGIVRVATKPPEFARALDDALRRHGADPRFTSRSLRA